MDYSSALTMEHLNISTTSKMLQTLRKIQFVSEFIIVSKFGQNSPVLPQFLMAIEACKFYYKCANFAEQENIYLQHNPLPEIDSQSPQPKDQVKKMSNLLDKIRQRHYQNNKHQYEMHETLPCGKVLQVVNTKEVPICLRRNSLNFRQTVGEILILLRPLVSIMAIRLFGQNNFKAYLLSMAIDLFILLVLQRGIKATNQNQLKQLSDRRRDVLMRYLFRRPFYFLLKRTLIQPVLKMVIKEERIFYRVIMGLLDMQSTITLTL